MLLKTPDGVLKHGRVLKSAQMTKLRFSGLPAVPEPCCSTEVFKAQVSLDPGVTGYLAGGRGDSEKILNWLGR